MFHILFMIQFFMLKVSWWLHFIFSFKSYYGFLKSIIVSILFSLRLLKHNILMQLSLFSLILGCTILETFYLCCILSYVFWRANCEHPFLLNTLLNYISSLFLQLTYVLEFNIWWFKVLDEQTTLDNELKCQF